MREPPVRTAWVGVSRHVSVPPERVWDCLADPRSFASWVAGTARIRSADPDWPALGSQLHHRWGLPLWHVRDHTTVVESNPPHRLVLLARARPVGVVRAELDLAADGRGTRIALRETLLSGWAARLPRLSLPVQRMRNRRSVRRLGELVERAPRYETGASRKGAR